MPEGMKDGRIALGVQRREAEIVVRAEAEKPPTYEIAISSEAEVDRWYGFEILDHSKSAVEMRRLRSGAAVLIDHGSDQIGVVENARIDDDRVLRGEIRFSQSQKGREVEQDVRDGIRKNISVGYMVKKIKRVEDRVIGKDEDGREITKPVYRVTRWEPAEVSIVSVPADVTVGVGREQDVAAQEVEIEPNGDAVREGRSDMPEKKDERTADVTVEPSNEEARAQAIRDICKTGGVTERASDFIASTLSPEAVAARVASLRATTGAPRPPADPMDAVPEKDRSRYSYIRAIRQKVAEAEGTGKFDGLEAEVHEELERAWPSDLKRHGGALLPLRTRTTMDSLTATKGVELVQDRPGEMIEVLRNRALVLASGARLMTLNGPVAFPKQTTGATVYWMPENPGADVADGEPSLGLAQMSLKTLMGNIPFTRQLLSQSSIDVEMWARSELGIGTALAIDKAAIHGRGNNGEPTGIYAASGVNLKNFTDLAGTKAVANWIDMAALIEDKNAGADTMRFLTTPLVAGLLRSNTEFSAAGASTMWQGNLRDGSISGWSASSTNQCSKTMTGSEPTGGTKHAAVFGNWADMLVALFGALEVTVDPYSRKKRAIIEVTTYQGADILIRHGESFAKGTNVSIA